MAIEILPLTRGVEVASGHGRLNNETFTLTGTGHFFKSNRGTKYLVLKTNDGVDLWLVTFTRVRQNNLGQDVSVPDDPFLNIAFKAVNPRKSDDQIAGFNQALEAIGFDKKTLKSFEKGLFNEGAPVPITLEWVRINTDGAIYYSVRKPK